MQGCMVLHVLLASTSLTAGVRTDEQQMRIYTVSSGVDFMTEEEHLNTLVYPVLHRILHGRTRLSWVRSLY